MIRDEGSIANPIPTILAFISLCLGSLGIVGQAAATGRLPPPAPERELLERAAARARLYRRYASRFSCRERIRVVNYRGEPPGARLQTEVTHGYLLFHDDGGALRELRWPMSTERGSRGDRYAANESRSPVPYLWTCLLGEEGRNGILLIDRGREIVHMRFAAVLEFTSGGTALPGWEGRVWIEADTGNLLRVEARPRNQERLLEVAHRCWLRWPDLRLQGLPFHLGRRPRWYEVSLDLQVERDGLTFPSRMEGRISLINDSRLSRELHEIEIREFSEYRLFQTDARTGRLIETHPDP